MQAVQHIFLSGAWHNRAVDDAEDAYWDQDKRRRMGSAVRSWMSARGIKKASLARDAGVGRGTLDHILAGEAQPRIETLARVAECLGTTVGTLIDGGTPSPTLLDAADDRRQSLGERVAALERDLLTTASVARDALALAQQLRDERSSHPSRTGAV